MPSVDRFEIEIERTGLTQSLVRLSGETIGRAFYYPNARAPKKWGAQVWESTDSEHRVVDDITTLFKTDTEAAFELVRYVSDKRRAAAIIASMKLEPAEPS